MAERPPIPLTVKLDLSACSMRELAWLLEMFRGACDLPWEVPALRDDTPDAAFFDAWRAVAAEIVARPVRSRDDADAQLLAVLAVDADWTDQVPGLLRRARARLFSRSSPPQEARRA